MNIGCPWRGLNVDPTETTKLEAVMYLYGGLGLPSVSTQETAANYDLRRVYKKKKRKQLVIRYSDFERREEYAKALEKAASTLALKSTPMSGIRIPDPIQAVDSEEEEDDDMLLQALTIILND